MLMKRRSFDGGQETSGVMNFLRRVSRTRTGVRRAGCRRHLFGTAAQVSTPTSLPHAHTHPTHLTPPYPSIHCPPLPESRPLDCQQMQISDSETEKTSEKAFFPPSSFSFFLFNGLALKRQRAFNTKGRAGVDTAAEPNSPQAQIKRSDAV